jgi:hypothetical protein
MLKSTIENDEKNNGRQTGCILSHDFKNFCCFEKGANEQTP